eukprot:COSAG01_NODE_32927_length_573_cov_0.706751_1_plen_86_part_10
MAVEFVEEQSTELREELDREKASNASRLEKLTALAAECDDRAAKAEEEASVLRKELEESSAALCKVREVQRDGLIAATLASGALLH